MPHFATPFVCCHLFMESLSFVMFAHFTHFAAAAHISCATYCNAQQWPRILRLKHAATFLLDAIGSWRVSAVYECLSQIGLPKHRLHIRWAQFAQRHLSLFWFTASFKCAECLKQMQWPDVLYLPLSSPAIGNREAETVLVPRCAVEAMHEPETRDSSLMLTPFKELCGVITWKLRISALGHT